MKTIRRSLLLSSLALLGAASLAFASTPKMDVTVSNSAGKVFFKGKTDTQGVFATKNLSPGDYVVQFNASSAKGGPFALVINVGKKKVSADSVPAAKFVKGGVAMRVEVGKEMRLVGQVAPVGQITVGNGDKAVAKGPGKVKYVNGKKYVWVEGGTGSNLGGHWADADSPEARNVTNWGAKDLQDYQSRSGFQGGGN
ncbi:MAG: hypothetical protein ACR2MW_12010 [Chthoniobacterales bacterium]